MQLKPNNAFCVCCWATCHSQQYKNIEFCTKLMLWRIDVAGKNRTYLGLHVKCSIFFYDFNQIWSVLRDFHKSIQYQSSLKSVQWQSCWNPNFNTLEPNQPQYDHLTARVIAQQQSPATFLSLHFHSRKEEYGTFFKNVTISIFYLFKNC